MHCEDCVYSGLCHRKEKDLYVIGCDSGNPKELKANADMIRGMTNIELAEFLIIYSKELGQYEYICDNNNGFYFGYVSSSREEAIEKQLEWLESEVSE